MTGAGFCAGCRHFEDDADAFERAFPGLLALGSGRGDARGDQGLCQVHGCMVTPDCACGSHGPRISIMDMDKGNRQDDDRRRVRCSGNVGSSGSGEASANGRGMEP